MRLSLRERLRQRYVFRCGYCGVSETDVGGFLTVDHFQPTSQGGTNSFSNLVYCCFICNSFKGDHWNPNGDERILHPLNDSMETHVIALEDGSLSGLTPTGRFHLEHLHLNRPQLVAHRHERQERVARTINDAVAASRQAYIEEQLREVLARIERLESRDPL